MTHNRQPIHLILIGLSFILLITMAFMAIESPVDDAFIVFRYVDRFVDGKGLTFNDHEYVEGYTSLSWTLLLTLLSYAGLDPNVASLLANYSFILLAGLTMYWLLLILRIDKVFRLIALFFFATSLLFFKVVYLGLELGMFIWLLLLFLCVLLMGLRFPQFDGISKPYLILSGALGALLFATRPEAAILAPFLVLACIAFWRSHKAALSQIHYFLVPFITLMFLVVLWRWLYYGEFLPNSVIAKSISLNTVVTPSLSWLRNILSGSAAYFLRAYKENPLFVFVAILSIYMVVKRKKPLILLLLLIPVAWQHLVIAINGGDWMPYFRFINLFIPLMIICLVVVLAQIIETSRFFGSIVLVVAVCLHLYTNLKYVDIKTNHLQQALGTELNDKWYEGDLYRAIGTSLNNIWIENDVLIPEAIGNISYYAPAIYIHDPSGLTDGELSKDVQARRSVYGRTDWHYSMRLNPAVIVLHWWSSELALEDLGDFEFYCSGPLPNSADGASLYVLIRRDRVTSYRAALLDLGLKSIPSTDRGALNGAATDWCTMY